MSAARRKANVALAQFAARSRRYRPSQRRASGLPRPSRSLARTHARSRCSDTHVTKRGVAWNQAKSRGILQIRIKTNDFNHLRMNSCGKRGERVVNRELLG